jgi:hypothetical protein
VLMSGGGRWGHGSGRLAGGGALAAGGRWATDRAEGWRAIGDGRGGGRRWRGESESETASLDTWQAAVGVTRSASTRLVTT